MIVWGGSFTTVTATFFLRGGARYNPVSDTWTPVALPGAPSFRTEHTAVWTGSEMIIWGGGTVPNASFWPDGARYNPTTDSWTTLPSAGRPSARIGHTAVWTGAEMVIWGGCCSAGSSGFYGDGARYNVSTNTWTALPTANAPSGRAGHSAVWSGAQMVVWGGVDANGYPRTGGRLALDVPTPVPTLTPTNTPLPSPTGTPTRPPSQVWVVIESPNDQGVAHGTVTISGYAIDKGALSGTGISRVDVYLENAYVGTATYGRARPDVGAQYGAQFTNSGYQFVLDTSSLNIGEHRFQLWVHSTVSGQVVPSSSGRFWVLAPSNVVAYIEMPISGTEVNGDFSVSGYAVDLLQTDNFTGVSGVEIYLDGPKDGGRYLGPAEYGLPRPDVATYFGNQRWLDSGWQLHLTIYWLSQGPHTLYASAHSVLSGEDVQIAAHTIVMTGLGTPTFAPTATPLPGAPTPTPSNTPTATPALTPRLYLPLLVSRYYALSELTATPTAEVQPTDTETPSVTPTISPTVTPTPADTATPVMTAGNFRG